MLGIRLSNVSSPLYSVPTMHKWPIKDPMFYLKITLAKKPRKQNVLSAKYEESVEEIKNNMTTDSTTAYISS